MCLFYYSLYLVKNSLTKSRKLKQLTLYINQIYFLLFKFQKMNTTSNKTNLFIFSDFFYTRPGIRISNDSSMEAVRCAYPNPIPYKNIQTLQPAFDLKINMIDSEIIKKLGGKDKVRKNVVCMSQIEQIIKDQWDGKEGLMLNNGRHNIFPVLDKNNCLSLMTIHWSYIFKSWKVEAFSLYECNNWIKGILVFLNS